MADYTQVTDFSVKDGLTSGDPEKIILGADLDVELAAISTAIATKYDSGDLASQAQALAAISSGASNSVLITPLRLWNWASANAGIVEEMQTLADPAADRIFFWDDGEAAGSNVAFLTVSNGLSIATTTLGIDDTAAGAGLTASSGVLAVGAGSGLTVNADDVAITDVAAGAAQPVAITGGTFTFDLSGITELAAEGVTQSADKVVVSDAGTIKVMPWDQMGLPVVSSAASQNFALTDVNTIQRNTGTGITWTIDPDATTDLEIGAFIILVNHHASATLSITAGVGVTLYSIYNAAATTATTDVVNAGGSAVLFKVAADAWQLTGDIADS